MANQKKGCGFLITALVLLIAGGVGAFILGGSAFNEAVNAGDSFKDATAFVTPDGADYTAGKDGETSVWLSGNDTSLPAGMSINVKDKSTGEFIDTSKSSVSQRMGEQLLIGTFEAKKGTDYKVHVTGLSAGRTILVSSVSSSAVMGTIGKGFGAIAIAGIAGFLALIFGIIGLVKYLGSKKADTPAPAATPPAV
ncbi:MAG: hypothetical protein AB8F34_04970 [Akkermansiaceae bacterium]